MEENHVVDIAGVSLRFQSGLWLGLVSSRFGVIEVLLGGTPTIPDIAKAEAYRRFAEQLDSNIARLRKQLFLGFLWQPIRIAINEDHLVGVQFRNRLTGYQGKLILDEPLQKPLRPVSGAAAVSSNGKVVYNLLTPHMQQFLGRCVGVIKKAGITARGTGEFCVVVGDLQKEIGLEEFYQPIDDPAAVDAVVAKAKELAAQK